MQRPTAAIAGVAEAGIGVNREKTALQLQAEAAALALADAGLGLAAVDGLFVSRLDLAPGDRPALEVAEYLGLRPSFIDSTLAGGAAPVMQVYRAAMAVTAGLCDTALVLYGSTQASSGQRKLGGHTRPGERLAARLAAQFDSLWGLPLPIGSGALAAARHMYQYGTTPEQLAAVAVSCREWGMRNPAALKREPITVADVLASPMICEPLHRLDICLVTDGAGAVVIRRFEAVSPGRRVAIAGYGEAHSHATLLGAPDLTCTPAVHSGRKAYAMAGLGPSEIDLVQIYDAYTILPVVLLEDLGFCAKGEGGPFVASGATRPGGHLPMNTQGGGLAHGHPGMYGIFQVVEAVRQLRGEAAGRQVDAEVALCQASGGGAFGGSQATLILTRG